MTFRMIYNCWKMSQSRICPKNNPHDSFADFRFTLYLLWGLKGVNINIIRDKISIKQISLSTFQCVYIKIYKVYVRMFLL